MGAIDKKHDSSRLERRVFDSVIELRAQNPAGDGDGKDEPMPMMVGYAAKFNVRSLPLGFSGFREQIAPTAFDECLAMGADLDCRFLFNHDPNKVFGRTKAGTLKLSRDAVGLRFECAPPENHAAKGLVESIRRGDISQCSFGFRTLDDDWSEDPDGTLVRTLRKVTIHNGDVSAVTYPAYPDTDVDVRSLDEIAAIGRERLHRDENVEGEKEAKAARAAAERDRELDLAEQE